jgi:hypothetical protein
VLWAAGETETTQEMIKDWIDLAEGDPGCQLLAEEEVAAVLFLYLFSSALPILLKVLFICFLSFLSFRDIFCFIKPDYRLILMTSQLI